jgi:hypothetical protein
MIDRIGPGASLDRVHLRPRDRRPTSSIWVGEMFPAFMIDLP